MKKALLSMTLIAAISMVTFGQGARFGVQAGTSIASQKAKASGLSITSDSKIGFTFGFLADVAIADMFTFQPGLNFTQKGSKIKMSEGGFTVEGNETLNYLELPLNLLYNAEAGNGKFFGGLGPVLGYGISGKSKTKMTGEPDEEHDVKFGSNVNEDDYKPFEFGGNILAGYEFSNGFFVAANYNMGFSNIAVDDSDNSSVKNRYFGIKIGYKFGSK